MAALDSNIIAGSGLPAGYSRHDYLYGYFKAASGLLAGSLDDHRLAFYRTKLGATAGSRRDLQAQFEATKSYLLSILSDDFAGTGAWSSAKWDRTNVASALSGGLGVVSSAASGFSFNGSSTALSATPQGFVVDLATTAGTAEAYSFAMFFQANDASAVAAGTTAYVVKIAWGAVPVLSLAKRVANVETAIASVNLPAGTAFRVRCAITGTRFQVRAWDANAAEPTSWPIDLTDTAVAPTQRFGLYWMNGASATILQGSFDNLVVS